MMEGRAYKIIISVDGHLFASSNTHYEYEFVDDPVLTCFRIQIAQREGKRLTTREKKGKERARLWSLRALREGQEED